MIQEAKNLGKNLIAAITPAHLVSNDVQPMDVTGKYDWNAQAYSYDLCNFGTQERTNTRTGNNGDSSLDSIGD